MVRSISYQTRMRVQGHLDRTWWSGVIDGLTLADEPDGTTLLSADLPDQAALHGLLAMIRDRGITLISVETVADPGTNTREAATDHSASGE